MAEQKHPVSLWFPIRNGRLESRGPGVMEWRSAGEKTWELSTEGRIALFHHGWDRMATDADFSHEANEENEEDSSPGNMRNTPLCILRSTLSKLPAPRSAFNCFCEV
jgi:hypothetical protein